MLTLTDAQWGQLKKVNTDVDHDYPGKSDLDLYGQADFWQRISVMGAGDCEDYALEKRARLMALGFPAAELRLAVVQTAQGEGHCVLTIDTQDGTMVLNNMAEDIETVEDMKAFGYTWIMRQAPNGFMWVKTGTV